MSEQEILLKLNLKKHIIGEIMKNDYIRIPFFNSLKETNTDSLNTVQSILFFELVSLGKSLFIQHSLFLQYIKDGKIRNKVQILEAIEFLKRNPDYDYKDLSILDRAIGVGLNYTQ